MRNRIIARFLKIDKIKVNQGGGNRMNSGVREIKVIKATKGLDAERKIRMAAYCRVSSDSEDQANSLRLFVLVPVIPSSA